MARILLTLDKTQEIIRRSLATYNHIYVLEDQWMIFEQLLAPYSPLTVAGVKL
jgi:hypothetical protein